MISEAINTLDTMSRAAIRLLKLPIDDPRRAYFDQRGTVLELPLPVPPRQHTVRTIESLSAAVNRYGGSATIWVSLTGAIAVLDDVEEKHRCDKVTFPVAPSPFFGVLEDQGWCSQKDLIDTLRHDLAGANLEPANALVVLRNLKFATASEQTGNFSNTSAKLGKNVESQVTGEAVLPETVSVEFHPYPQLDGELDESVVIFCTLFTDPATARLKLAPQPGQLEAAKTRATQALRLEIAEKCKNAAVFIGTP